MARRSALAAVAVTLSLIAVPVVRGHAGSVDGASLYDQECADCHSLQRRNKKGPSLAGIAGRKAGSVPDFGNYSDALVASGIVWSKQSLEAYIADPRRVVPGGRMRYDGLSDPVARAAIADFLLDRR